MAECSEIKLKIEEEWSDNEMTDQLKHQQSDAMLQQGAVVKIEIENSDGEESHDVKPELDIGETMLQCPGNHYMITEPKVEINEEEPPTTSSDQNNSGEKLNPGRAASTNTDKDDIGLEVELKEVHHPFMYYQLFMEPKIEINTPSQSDNEGSSSLEINGTLGDGPVNTKSGGRRSNQTFTIVTDESENSKKPGKKLYCCADCGQSFHRFSRLKEHRRTHTGEKPYTCEFCNKTFFTSSNLSMHVKTHTGDKPFECPTCGKSFVRLYHLNRHFLTHTGEKPYPCVDCGQKFSRQSHLDEHRTTHTGIKPFPCVVCGQRFARSSHLEEHKTVHSGVKAHNCPDCGKNFSRSSYLRIHRRSVHHINI